MSKFISCVIFVLLFSFASLASREEIKSREEAEYFISEKGKYCLVHSSKFVRVTDLCEKKRYITYMPLFHEGKYSADMDYEAWTLSIAGIHGFLANIVIISQDCDPTLGHDWYKKEYLQEIKGMPGSHIRVIQTDETDIRGIKTTVILAQFSMARVFVKQAHYLLMYDKRFYTVIITYHPVVEDQNPEFYKKLIKGFSPY
jgi:hypothetical protein